MSGNCPRKNCPSNGQKQAMLSAIITLSEVKGALFLSLSTDFCYICSHITYPLRSDLLLPLPKVRIKVGAELWCFQVFFLAESMFVKWGLLEFSLHLTTAIFQGQQSTLVYISPRKRLKKCAAILPSFKKMISSAGQVLSFWRKPLILKNLPLI